MSSYYTPGAGYGQPAYGRGRPAGQRTDVHELLKRELAGGEDVHETLKGIAFEGDPRCVGHAEKQRPCPATIYGVSDQHVVLDSALATEASPSKGTFRFNFAVQRVAGDHLVGVRDTLETVTQIQTYPITMALPTLNALPTAALGVTLTPDNATPSPADDTDPVGGAMSQLAHGSRVTLYISEFGDQCHYDFKGRRHHFEYDATIIGTVGTIGARLLLTPVNPIFTFTEPILDITHMTLSFYGPDEPLRFPVDEVRNVQLSTNGAGNLVITVPATASDGAPTDLTQILVGGDRIFLDNVRVGDGTTTYPSLDTYLSRPDGLWVGPAGVITATSFTTDPLINPDGFGASESLPLLASITLRIAKNRMRAPFRFRKVVPRLTNYIAP